MKSPIKTISLPEETYNILKAQAEEDGRTIGGQIKYLLKLSGANNNGWCDNGRVRE